MAKIFMMTDHIQPCTPVRTYLVLVSEVVVAQDIALTIGDFDPGARVLVATSVEAAHRCLDGVGALAVAFVTERPSLFTDSVLAKAIAARRGRVVLLGLDAETSGPTPLYDVLAQPFDTDAVVASLARRA